MNRLSGFDVEWGQSPGRNNAPHAWSPDCRGSGCVKVRALTDAEIEAIVAARLASVKAVLAQHWDWKAGRSLHAALRAALRSGAHTEQKGAGQ